MTSTHFPVLKDLTQSPATESAEPPQFETTSAISNPSSSSHETYSLADVDVGSLYHIEMSIFKPESTGGQLIIPVVVLVMSLTMSLEAAIVLWLHGRDGSTREVVGMISYAVGEDNSDGTDGTDETLPRDSKLICDQFVS